MSKVTKDESQSSDDEFVPRPTRRLTRQQARTANRNPEPTPSVRTRRTRACKSNKKSPDIEKETEPVSIRSSVVGIDSDEVIKVTNNRLSRELSVTRNSRGSTCRVSVEKVSLTVSNATAQPETECVAGDNIRPEATPTTTVAETNMDYILVDSYPGEDNRSNGSEQLRGTKSSISKSVADSSPHTNTGLPHAGADTVDGENKEKTPPLPQRTPLPSEPDGDVEMSLARPTPPRRKALKLRKKVARKPASKPRTRAAELREHTDIANSPTLLDDPNTTAPVHQESLPAVPPSSSADSMYESCVSQLGTPTKKASSAESAHSPIPHVEYETPPTVTRPTGTMEQQEETPISPSNETQTEDNSEGDDGLSSPPPPTLSEAPSVDTPSYLTGTPRTLLKLREEYQSRTGGKLVSLTDLLNSGG